MRLRCRAIVPLLLAMADAPAYLGAGTAIIDFEGLPDNTVLISQYPNVAFSNAALVTAGMSLDEFEFAPHSGNSVLFDAGGPVTITFSSPQQSISAYVTHSQGLVLRAYDAQNQLLSTINSPTNRNLALSGDAGANPNELITIAGTNITKVTITGNPAGTSFTLDDLAFTASGTPPFFQFVPVTPCRIMDSRVTGGFTGLFGPPSLTGGVARTVPLPSGSCNIPTSAAAYSLNVTVLPLTGTLGYLTVWPTGQQQPGVSTLNSPGGSILANAAIVPAGSNGAISLFALQNTDVVVDINGYFTPPGAATLQFYPLAPCRVLDTRGAGGSFGGPAIAGGASRSFPIPSSGCGAPAGAAAYSFNVTAAPRGFLGFVTAWPTGQPQPLVSTLNSLDGAVLANAAIVPAGTGGAVSFFANNTTDLVVDINGYFAAPGSSGLNFYPGTPCRVIDTRNGNGPLGGPILPGNTSRTFPVPASPCSLPSTASAYSFNVTVQPSGPLGYLTTWPTGQTQPFVSTLNAPKGLVVANAAIVPAGTAGSINVYVLQNTHVIIDTNGYFGQ